MTALSGTLALPEAVVVEVTGVALEDARPRSFPIVDDFITHVPVQETSVETFMEGTFKDTHYWHFGNPLNTVQLLPTMVTLVALYNL